MNMLAREVAIYLEQRGVGTFTTANQDERDIFVGDFPADKNEGMTVLISPSPPPHEYIVTEYPVLDFWYRSPHTDRAYEKLQEVYNVLHRNYGYTIGSFYVYFSRSLGSIVDIDRDNEGGKMFRLSVQFTCRNLNQVS